MGKKNNVICDYLENPERFADFINGCLYGGRQEVLPEHITESQTVYSKVSRSRDILKKVCREESYILIGVENQDMVHYAMPLRCMEYDVLEYKKQLKQLKEEYCRKQAEKRAAAGNRRDAADEQAAGGSDNTDSIVISGAEFLSGMKKGDRLNPVTTIVFYHGEDEYDGCRNLHDMLNFEKRNEIFKRYVTNYQMNLVTLRDLEEANFRTGIRELIGFLKRRKNKTELSRYCRDNEKRIQNMDRDTFEAISVMINKTDFLERKDNYRQEGGKLDMCQAMEEWGEDLKNEGREEGIKAFVWANMDELVPEVRIVEKLQKYFGLDAESAQNYFAKYAEICS